MTDAASATQAEHEAGAILTVDLAAIADNWRTLAARTTPAECAAVVKANAYGLGIDHVAPALWAAGARTFFVAHLTEAVHLRRLLPDAVIHALNGLLPGSAPAFAAHAIRPVLGSMPEIDEWSAHGQESGANLPAAIHVDTGMHRLGLSMDEVRHLSARQGERAFTPCLVMSHLACADAPGHPLTGLQRQRFAEAAGYFPQARASLANSAGTLMGGDFLFDLVRPGIALYGGAAISGLPPLKPVVRLEAKVIQVSSAPAGETVGYGATQRLTRDSRLATVHIGYADGFFRAAGSTNAHRGAEAVVSGRRCPLVGRISMDLATLDITDLPAEAVARGDSAVFLGDGIGVDELAAKAGTIGYEVLTALGSRYLRRYSAA